METATDYLVIGGGIAGVSCVEMLGLLAPEASITLLTATHMVKSISELSQITKLLTDFKVVEKGISEYEEEHQGIRIIQGMLTRLDPDNRCIYYSTSNHNQMNKTGKEDSSNISESHEVRELRLGYGKVCICTGATPRLIAEDNDHVYGIRDTASVAQLQEKLSESGRVLVVGNGGIATELVYELENIDIVWAIKDKSISSVFLDPGAAQFLLDHLHDERDESAPVKRLKFTVEQKGTKSSAGLIGSALGPDWHKGFSKKGSKSRKNIDVKYGVEVKRLLTKDEMSKLKLEQEIESGFPVYVELTDGSWIGTDFVISATGVTPNGSAFRDILNLSAEDGIIVDDNMRSSRKDVYAAGDVCTAGWDWAPHWFQMRLWTQARLQGMFAAKCMQAHATNQSIDLDFSFEMFTHVTKFFGFKVILLGLYKGQTLDNNYEILLRVTKGKEFVKTVMKDGRMQGAVLIGDTDLEETFENLILNQMDLSVYGEDLLDPNIDIEDYFD